MGVMVLKDGFLIIKACAIACFLMLPGSAALLYPQQSSAPINSATSPERFKDPILPAFPPSNSLLPPAPSRISSNNQSISPGISPGSLSPIPHENESTEIPIVSAPSSAARSGISPILPPSHSAGPEVSPSSFPVPAVSPPQMSPDPLPGNPPQVQPALPVKPPSIMPELPLQQPYQTLPPPPRNADCISLTCLEPLTNGPPGSSCVCVLPMQVGLCLSVALYTFLPMVSELSAEVATGIFLKPSQVRIVGANAANDDSEKTIVLLDLVPLGESFDSATAYLIFRRFWLKKVHIEASLFGDYEVLYARYPGLPPSPPTSINIVNSDPYYGHGNGAAIKPLGVDVGRKKHKGKPSKSVIAIVVLSASLAVIFGCGIAWFLVFRHRDHLCQQESIPSAKLSCHAKRAGIGASVYGSAPCSASLSLPSSIAAYTGSAMTFTSSDIERATENFSETRIIGEGGFGRVYSGVLEDDTKVAVKVLKRADQQGGREFLAEVEMLSWLHHRNLVKLIGICIEERTRCLVYELVPNGSVESHLHGVHEKSAPLDWAVRLKIALGAARGLSYLHEDSSPRVIHRDFKSSNILLEHDFTPKVSDFGLAKTAPEEEGKHISTRVMGTFGYVAPEYAMTGHLLVKSDVYSYGVVLLELLTGRKPVDMSQPPGEENLVSWARPLLTSKEGLESIIDSSLGPDFPFDSVSKMAAIASMCVQSEVSHRPFMGEVVQALKLVCNERDKTEELGSASFSQEDISIDMDAVISDTSGHLHSPLCNQFRTSGYDTELDVERDLSGSYLLDSSARYAGQYSGPLGGYSSSGPLRTGKTKQLWQKMRQLSGGSFSDHSLIFSSWHRSL